MKTREEFYNDTLGAMRALEQYWHDKGYEVSVFTDIAGEYVCSVAVEDEGEEVEYIATFDRV